MCGTSCLRHRGIHPGYLMLKLTLGVLATFFWLVGLIILCIGIYAEVERQQNKTMDSFFIAPAVILLLLGVSMFTVSFAGMVGALRDNRLLLKVFKWTLVTVVVLQLIFIIVSLLCQNKVLLLFKANVREGIKHYYDDLDFKNILDRIQVKFSCCGGDEYKDWNVNQYHACDAPGPSACGVPYTCCMNKQGDVINTQCGYQTLHKEVTGIVLSCLYLRSLSQHGDEFDGPKMSIPYELLDVSGAGWCLCLPREEGYQLVEGAACNADIPDAVNSNQGMQLVSAEQEVN
ncbi:tetraspanin-15 isoform X2 [Scyliorhinus torazame]|uniref:tetraspanin-15 isoform X2 n=1 Tax=Scyliorhinus torazame TaxID=75743 RepID=UPI003B5AA72A